MSVMNVARRSSMPPPGFSPQRLSESQHAGDRPPGRTQHRRGLLVFQEQRRNCPGDSAKLFQSDLASLKILLDNEARHAQRVEQFSARYVEIYSEYAWLNPAGIQFYAEAAHDLQVRGFIQEYLAGITGRRW